jgi:hypothetical protein
MVSRLPKQLMYTSRRPQGNIVAKIASASTVISLPFEAKSEDEITGLSRTEEWYAIQNSQS